MGICEQFWQVAANGSRPTRYPHPEERPSWPRLEGSATSAPGHPSRRRVSARLLRMRIAALFNLDARELDYPRPLVDGVCEDRAEFRRRAAKHCAAQLDDPGFDFAIGKAGIEFLVQQ